MANYRAVLTLKPTSGVLGDQVVSTYSFSSPEAAAVPGTASAIASHVLTAFSSAADAGGTKLETLISPEISRTDRPVCNVYDRIGGSPLASVVMGIFGASADVEGLPSEVASVLSFSADLTGSIETAPDDGDLDTRPERPRSRLRGRVYIGPFNKTASIGAPSRPKGTVRGSLIDFGVRLANIEATPALLTANVRWAVWSKENRTARTITTVSVDDAWDIQRRRGVKQTLRTIQPVTQP